MPAFTCWRKLCTEIACIQMPVQDKQPPSPSQAYLASQLLPDLHDIRAAHLEDLVLALGSSARMLASAFRVGLSPLGCACSAVTVKLGWRLAEDCQEGCLSEKSVARGARAAEVLGEPGTCMQLYCSAGHKHPGAEHAQMVQLEQTFEGQLGHGPELVNSVWKAPRICIGVADGCSTMHRPRCQLVGTQAQGTGHGGACRFHLGCRGAAPSAGLWRGSHGHGAGPGMVGAPVGLALGKVCEPGAPGIGAWPVETKAASC